MSKQVMHSSHVVRYPDGRTRTGTLCGRSTLTDDGMNVADGAEVVTCKLCLRRLEQSAKAKANPNPNRVARGGGR